MKENKRDIKMNIKRNSSIELLKIVGMIFIAISHSVPGEVVNINIASTDITMFILVLLRNLGHIGNLIFIISSAWFLLDSKTTKKEKCINLIIDTFCISMIFLYFLSCAGVEMSSRDIFKQFFPIIYENN